MTDIVLPTGSDRNKIEYLLTVLNGESQPGTETPGTETPDSGEAVTAVNLLSNPNFTAGDALGDVLGLLWYDSATNPASIKSFPLSAYHQNTFQSNYLGQSVKVPMVSHWGLEHATPLDTHFGYMKHVYDIGQFYNVQNSEPVLRKRLTTMNNSSDALVYFSLFDTPDGVNDTELYSLSVMYSDEVVYPENTSATAAFDKWGIAELDANHRVVNVVVECGFGGTQTPVFEALPQKEFVTDNISLKKKTTYAAFYRMTEIGELSKGISAMAVYQNPQALPLKPSYLPVNSDDNGIALTHIGSVVNDALQVNAYLPKFSSKYPIHDRFVMMAAADNNREGSKLMMLDGIQSVKSSVVLNSQYNAVTNRLSVSGGSLLDVISSKAGNANHDFHVYLFESSHPLEIGFWDFMKQRHGYQYSDSSQGDDNDTRWKRLPASDNFIDVLGGGLDV
ncbi:hypothetical protein SPN99_004043 [Vibrio fluvialis]|nr:hypothetical protein [Vibrio fluvialis]